MKVGDVMITIWVQSREKVEAYIQQGWEVVYIRRGYMWINHLLKLT
jgi:hypothetical protein